MGRFKQFFLLDFLATFVLLQLVYGQNQQGFISIDCGSNTSYTEPITGLNYVSDSDFIDTGTIRSIPSNDISTTLLKQLWNLRSFPNGTRSCYNVKVKLGIKYLIRASFLYANYDGQNTLPEFDLHFGPNFWVTVQLQLAENIIHEEIIHVTTSNNVQVCLVNTGNGVPFISALELRPLANSSYNTVSGSLTTFLRLDIGSKNDSFLRFPDDIYDRVWSPPVTVPEWTPISTSLPVNNRDAVGLIAPSTVLNTASTVVNSSAPMIIPWSDPNQLNQFYVYMYFAELEILRPNQSRTFRIYLNEELWYSKDVSPIYLTEYFVYTTTPLSSAERYIFNLIKSNGSTLPPILNALEIFKVINLTQPTTNQEDVNAIESIKETYKITKADWQGDPCAPKTLAWQALNCTYDNSNPPKITGLNLSSSGLTGEITFNISKLVNLETLDLSNNNLSGSVPNFLADLPLRVLNLSGNSLSGQVPSALIDKRNKGSLNLSLDGNPNLYTTAPSEKKKNNIVIPIVAAVGGVIIILLIIAFIYYFNPWNRSPTGHVTTTIEPNSPQISHFEPHSPKPLDQSPTRRFSYSDILQITNHFDSLLGEGGFGKVYYGRIGNTEVAIKMLSPKSAQGYREFQAEVDLLLRVHHRNLTSLVGYCNEGEEKMGLIYEYMGKGNLGSILIGGRGEALRWKDRLQIALDSAQGLEYLHNGCRPPIIHRDIKSSNILLSEHLQAKLADFGLSRAFPLDGSATHVTTKVVGTPGYLDPEYYTSFRLTEKSDVYSFGIVLLELITGRPVLVKTSERSHIAKWVEFNINQGDIYSIIDPNIKEGCNVNSVWKAVDTAMTCTASDSTNRPTMGEVVSDLKECLNLELNQNEDRQVDSTTSISSTFNYEYGPMAR